MVLGSPPRVLYVFHKGIPIRDSIDKCPKGSILMWPPKWFTMISSNFPVTPYIYIPVPPLPPAWYTSNIKDLAVDNFFVSLMIIILTVIKKYG